MARIQEGQHLQRLAASGACNPMMSEAQVSDGDWVSRPPYACYCTVWIASALYNDMQSHIDDIPGFLTACCAGCSAVNWRHGMRWYRPVERDGEYLLREFLLLGAAQAAIGDDASISGCAQKTAGDSRMGWSIWDPHSEPLLWNRADDPRFEAFWVLASINRTPPHRLPHSPLLQTEQLKEQGVATNGHPGGSVGGLSLFSARAPVGDTGLVRFSVITCSQ
jgi:hypothetical protein